MDTPYRIALLGFSDFERSTLASVFRLAGRRTPAYALVAAPAQAQFLVADADHAPTVREVTAAGRVDDAVFIGNRPPPGATAWMLRPIDPLHVMRELDAMVALQAQDAPPPAARAQPQWPTPLPGQAARPAPAPRAGAPLHPPLLPVQPAPALAAPAAAQAPQALLVDDSEIARAHLARRLQRWGVQCTPAADAARALELLAGQRFDLVFVDVELGPASSLDGLALCQRLRRDHPPHGPGVPLLALISAHHSEIDRARGTLAGADAYLGKPLDEEALARVLRRQGIRPADDPAAR